MANVDKAKGLVAINIKNGNSNLGEYNLASGYSTTLAKGDPVVKVAGASANDKGQTKQRVGKAAVSSKGILGAISHFEYIDSQGEWQKTRLWTGSTTTEGGVDARVYVYDSPNQEFEIQVDDASVNADNFGHNASFVFGAADTVNKISGAELDGSSAAADANGDRPLRIVGVSSDNRNNDLDSANVNVVVRINNHANGSASAVAV